MIEIKATNRGFAIGEFKDEYGLKCSIQKSSLADKDCIWLGVDDPDPKILVPGKSWQPYPIPEDVQLSTRMHLTREMVKDLLPQLQHFARTGELKSESDFPEPDLVRLLKLARDRVEASISFQTSEARIVDGKAIFPEYEEAAQEGKSLLHEIDSAIEQMEEVEIESEDE